MITIGLISDTHIPERARSLAPLIHDMFKEVDVILHAGDITDEDVIIELQTIAPVEAVCGNMDCCSTLNLPEFKVLEFEDVRIGLCHGAGNRHNIIDRMIHLFKPKKVDVIVFGHTHKSIITEKNGVYLINPGSASDRVFSESNSIGILKVNDGKVIRIEIIELLFDN